MAVPRFNKRLNYRFLRITGKFSGDAISVSISFWAEEIKSSLGAGLKLKA